MTSADLDQPAKAEWREPWKPGRIWRDGSHFPEMIDLPRGFFMMGEQPDDKFAGETERPRHRVVIAYSLALGRYPVTVAEYAAFTGESYSAGEGALPAAGVNWHEAAGYAQWLSDRTRHCYRLPSEAEWEYACRGGAAHAFPNGDALSPTDANFYYDECGERVGPARRTRVGSYPANGFGLFDMAGNVCEWVADEWHPTFLGAPVSGESWCGEAARASAPAAGNRDRRVLRGGAWDYMPRLLRNAWRDFLDAATHRDNVGFRVACDVHAGA